MAHNYPYFDKDPWTLLDKLQGSGKAVTSAICQACTVSEPRFSNPGSLSWSGRVRVLLTQQDPKHQLLYALRLLDPKHQLLCALRLLDTKHQLLYALRFLDPSTSSSMPLDCWTLNISSSRTFDCWTLSTSSSVPLDFWHTVGSQKVSCVELNF